MASLTYTIDDDITEPLLTSIEVTIQFGSQKRWLYFATPQLLASVGDWVEGTRARLHLGERHMIIVSELTHEIIDKVLHQLDRDGDLESRTVPLEAP